MRVCLDNLKGRGRGKEWVLVFGLSMEERDKQNVHLCLDYLKGRCRGTRCESVDYVKGRERRTELVCVCGLYEEKIGRTECEYGLTKSREEIEEQGGCVSCTI